MELLVIQVCMIFVAATVLATLYWQSYKESKTKTEPRNGLLPSQKARLSRLLLRKKQVKDNRI